LSDVVTVLPALVLLAGAGSIAAGHRLLRIDSVIASTLGVVVALVAASAAGIAGVGHDALGGAIRRDSAAIFFSALIGAATATALAIGNVSPPRVALLVLSSAGATLVAASGHLATLVTGCLLLAVPLLVERKLGSALPMLVAIALLGLGTIDVGVATGSASLGLLDAADSTLGLAGIALLIAGLVLAAGVMPFRTRERDVVTEAHLNVIPRIAAIAGLLRVGSGATLSADTLVDWRSSLAVVAAVSIALATLIALGQTSLRRTLAYGWIAQAGHAAMALTAGLASGPAAAFFLATFAILTTGTLALVAALPADARLADLRGLSRRRPLFVTSLALLLLAGAGLPPTAGFLAKLYVIEIAVSAQLAWLAILAAIASAVSVAAYLRIVFACLGEGGALVTRGRVPWIGYAAALLVLVIGLFPIPLLNAVQNVRF